MQRGAVKHIKDEMSSVSFINSSLFVLFEQHFINEMINKL